MFDNFDVDGSKTIRCWNSKDESGRNGLMPLKSVSILNIESIYCSYFSRLMESRISCPLLYSS